MLDFGDDDDSTEGGSCEDCANMDLRKQNPEGDSNSWSISMETWDQVLEFPRLVCLAGLMNGPRPD